MKVKIFLYIISLIFCFTGILNARYRAYKLEIKNSLNDESYEITTTLSPEAYLVYGGANKSFHEITVLSTWMCWGNTSYFKQICPDPREQEEESSEVIIE